MDVIRAVLDVWKRIWNFLSGQEAPEGTKPLREANAAPPRVEIPARTESPWNKEYQRRLQELTKPGFWMWQAFREILIDLAVIGEGKYLPAARIPKIIFIDGILPILADLVKISREHRGVETSRAVLVDWERKNLLQSGRTKLGDATSVFLDVNAEPGREGYQIPVVSIHLHPRIAGSQLFSDNDFVAFLTDSRLILMVLSNGSDVFMALKTSATRSRMELDEIRRHIASTKQDILDVWKRMQFPMPEWAVNKAICTEYGLVLYELDRARNGMTRHIPVTEG